MSTARNHAKRSHRSQQVRYYAGLRRYRIAVQQQNTADGGPLGGMAKLFRRTRESKTDI